MEYTRSQHEIYLFSQLKKGDEKAFNYFFNYYYSGLCIFARKFLNNPYLEEETVQSIFLKFWQDRNTIEIHESVRAYLFRSVRNKCLDEIKHLKVKKNYLEGIKPEEYQSNETWEAFVEAELYSLINDSIDKLPPECAKVFRFSRIEQLKNKEIASKLGISVKTVDNQIVKALKMLRKELKEYLTLLI